MEYYMMNDTTFYCPEWQNPDMADSCQVVESSENMSRIEKFFRELFGWPEKFGRALCLCNEVRIKIWEKSSDRRASFFSGTPRRLCIPYKRKVSLCVFISDSYHENSVSEIKFIYSFSQNTGKGELLFSTKYINDWLLTLQCIKFLLSLNLSCPFFVLTKENCLCWFFFAKHGNGAVQVRVNA